MTTDARAARLCLALALLALGWAVFASAWLCDDAWITLRSVDNWLSGYGLRWNPAERVQTFTHPAWALLLAAATGISGERTFTLLGVSLACSAGAVALLVRHVARGPGPAALAVVTLLASKAFVDYSTSGLENPLTHLLLALFFALWFRASDADPPERHLLALTLVAAVLAVNRLDTLLLVTPAVAVTARACGRSAWRALALGALPLLAWELFALVYYGFPFPNTAYAKLATGIPAIDLARQGLRYLQDAGVRDPATPLAILLGCGLATWRAPRSLAVVIGIVLYLAYVVQIGGDFMSGRFLAAPVFCAATLLARTPSEPGWPALRVPIALAAGLLVASLLSARPPLTATLDYGVGWKPDPGAHGIVDERAGYYPVTGLWRALAAGADPLQHPWAAAAAVDRRRPNRVLLAGPVGLYGFHVGPEKYVLDEFALADPLRARLPVQNLHDWRIGHFSRSVPDGYLETLETGRNQIADADLAALWDALARVTRGPLFTAARWRAILHLNLMALPHQTAGQQ
ncbi:MAG: hypothetical protein JRG84_16870 [Deltaproteobacteria bacterium]|nr:hypothetical protein [Deltaproteobacteria bacterium]